MVGQELTAEVRRRWPDRNETAALASRLREIAAGSPEVPGSQ
jgi:hypothetical protein